MHFGGQKKKKKNAQKREGWEFSGGPLVRTLSFTAEGAGLILGQGTRIPQTGLYLAKKKHKKQKKKSILLRRDSFWERCKSPKALEFKD